jgi:hypothetical protein
MSEVEPKKRLKCVLPQLREAYEHRQVLPNPIAISKIRLRQGYGGQARPSFHCVELWRASNPAQRPRQIRNIAEPAPMIPFFIARSRDFSRNLVSKPGLIHSDLAQIRP